MTVDALLIFLGSLVAVLPFLGIPVRYDNVILLAIGIIVVFLGVIVRRRGLIPRPRRERRQNVYVENVPRDAHERA